MEGRWKGDGWWEGLREVGGRWEVWKGGGGVMGGRVLTKKEAEVLGENKSQL